MQDLKRTKPWARISWFSGGHLAWTPGGYYEADRLILGAFFFSNIIPARLSLLFGVWGALKSKMPKGLNIFCDGQACLDSYMPHPQ